MFHFRSVEGFFSIFFWLNLDIFFSIFFFKPNLARVKNSWNHGLGVSGKTSSKSRAVQVSFSSLPCLTKHFSAPRNREKGWGWKEVFKLDLKRLLRGTFLQINMLPATGCIPIPFAPWRVVKCFTKSWSFQRQQISSASSSAFWSHCL